MLTVASVLWGDWCNGRGPEYVRRLRDSVKARLSVPHRFVCIADAENAKKLDCDVIPSKRPEFPGWWQKVQLFDGEITKDGPALYFDLDTALVGSIDSLVDPVGLLEEPRPFTCLRDFYRPALMASGMMYFPAGDATDVWDRFVDNPEWAVSLCGGYGDGLWMQLQRGRQRVWQDSDPGKVVSYKADVRDGAGIGGASVVCFHGFPRPHEVLHEPWMRSAWPLEKVAAHV